VGLTQPAELGLDTDLNGEHVAIDKLAIQLALHGVLVVIVGVIAGLLLYRSILDRSGVADTRKADWHLLHAGGTARGILLIALAAIIHLPALAPWQLQLLAWSIIYFVWTSTLAMLIRAVSGEPGFRWTGTASNRLVYFLYATGTLTLFPGLLLLAVGLYRALD